MLRSIGFRKQNLLYLFSLTLSFSISLVLYIPRRFLLVNSQITWWWLVFCFDTMIYMVVIHLTVVIVVVLLACIICTVLDYIACWRTVIFAWYQIQRICMCCWCWHSRYVQICVSVVYISRIWHLWNITPYFF